MTTPTKDLLVLVADKDMELTIKGLLNRHQALHIRPVSSEVYTHSEHDPGCLLRGHDFLRPFIQQYTYAMVMLDRAGCGRESASRTELEHEIEQRLSQSGWDNRSAAVVVDPELEIWVWSDSPHVARVLGWEGRQPDLRTWLQEKAFVQAGQVKPDDPKGAVEQALREARKPRSSAIYAELARLVRFQDCVDPAFVKFKQVLQQWFSEEIR